MGSWRRKHGRWGETTERSEKTMRRGGISYILCENRGRTSEANFVHIAAKISELSRGDSPANSGQAGKHLLPHLWHCCPALLQAPSSPFLEEKTLSLLSSLFLCWRDTKLGKGCRIGVSAQQTGDAPLGEPSADWVSWQRCAEPRSVMLVSGHPSWVLEQQRFRDHYCFKLASD